MTNRASSSVPFVDLFCGAGGLSVGFEQAGFKSVYAIDNDKDACNTYDLNHPDVHVHCGNIEEITGKNVFEATGLENIPLVIGGPNCQGVSLRGNRDPNDPKNLAFLNFVRLIDEIQPEWFVMENVPGLMHRHNRELAASIFAEFEQIGYKCGGEVLLAADYGAPQLRYRLIIIGNRLGNDIYFPDQTHTAHINKPLDDFITELPCWRSTRDAISDLPVIRNGGGAEFIRSDKSVTELIKRGADQSYLRYCRSNTSGFYDHQCHKSSDKNIEMIKYIPAGGNWKNIPENIRPARFKKVALKDHTTTYGRLKWDMPSRTITTYFNNISSGAFTHPTQNRGISIREGARFQSFPDNFRFTGSLAKKYRQVGNAVPPLLAFNVARPIYYSITNQIAETFTAHEPAITYDRRENDIVITRPLQGMRFNLDKHLVVGDRHGISNQKRNT